MRQRLLTDTAVKNPPPISELAADCLSLKQGQLWQHLPQLQPDPPRWVLALLALQDASPVPAHTAALHEACRLGELFLQPNILSTDRSLLSHCFFSPIRVSTSNGIPRKWHKWAERAAPRGPTRTRCATGGVGSKMYQKAVSCMAQLSLEEETWRDARKGTIASAHGSACCWRQGVCIPGLCCFPGVQGVKR